MSARRAIVLGGGIAGLSAAIGLRQAGFAVLACEQAEEIAPVGAAISLWPNAVAALRRLGALDRIAAEAAPITAMLLATRDARPLLGPWRIDPARHGEPAYLATRALVQAALREAIGGAELRLGRCARTVRDLGDAAEVAFDDGQVERADLVVAADGIWSSTATALLGNPLRPRGYGGVLALSDPVGGPPLDGLAAEYWGEGDRFGLFDLGGGRRYWFYMAQEPLGAPDHAALLATAAAWPDGIARAIAATPPDRLIPVAIAARAPPRRLGRGRVVCVGDAAHAMEPNLGQGACQALEDAVALGAIASRSPPAEVAAALSKARRGRVAAIMRRAAEGGWAAHGSPPVRRAWRAVFRLAPAALSRRQIDSFYRLPTL